MPLARSRKASLLATVIAVVSLAVPIAWDSYSSRLAIEVHVLSQSVVMGSREGRGPLAVTYEDVPVTEFSRLELALRNAGRQPIREADFVAAPRITIDSGRILETRLEAVAPEGLAATIRPDTASGSVQLVLPLLNPGDVVRFSLLVESSARLGVTAAVRVPGLRAVRVVDRRAPHGPLWRRIPWTAYPAALGTVLAFLLSAIGLLVIAHARLARRFWRDWPFPAPAGATAEDYRRMLSSALAIPVESIPAIARVLAEAPPAAPLAGEAYGELRAAVDGEFRDLRVWLTWITVVAFALSVLGTWYVTLTLVRAAGTGV
ncbi:MAG: hypothetical protein ACREMJ_04320 [Gemmatimonadales bacterium]